MSDAEAPAAKTPSWAARWSTRLGKLWRPALSRKEGRDPRAPGAPRRPDGAPSLPLTRSAPPDSALAANAPEISSDFRPKTLDAVYLRGALVPLRPLDLPDGVPVRLTVRPARADLPISVRPVPMILPL